jgi:16S rRNA (guanine(966)-N(2))-methyltransferase RsmD
MRIIGGRFGGRRLRTLRGLDVRPTSDRLRETLFNIISARIEGSRFLDICAGSGAVGIEALSRGARETTFIERSRQACSTLRANLNALDIDSQARIINREAPTALKVLAEEGEQFDIVFFDPPYSSGIYTQVLEIVSQSEVLTDEGLVIVEHRVKMPPRWEFQTLSAFREVRQGESGLTFFERRSAADSS